MNSEYSMFGLLLLNQVNVGDIVLTESFLNYLFRAKLTPGALLLQRRSMHDEIPRFAIITDIDRRHYYYESQNTCLLDVDIQLEPGHYPYITNIVTCLISDKISYKIVKIGVFPNAGLRVMHAS